MPHVHAPGLVLQFDPQTLLTHGATCSWKDEETELSAASQYLRLHRRQCQGRALGAACSPEPGPVARASR
jgi:hypothetical protein